MGLPGPVTRSSPAAAVQSAPHFPFVPLVMSLRLVLEPPAEMAVSAAGRGQGRLVRPRVS